MDDASLQQLFASHGNVARAKVITDRDTGRSRGFAFVTMDNDSEAESAIAALNGADIKGRNITVRKAEPRPPREGGGFGGGAPRREGFGRREGGGGGERRGGGYGGGYGGGDRGDRGSYGGGYGR
jgi:RNA recognition motif-containing protein